MEKTRTSIDDTYVNNAFASERDLKESKLGKLYWGIDFKFIKDVSEMKMIDNKQPVIGKLLVGKSKIPLTISECKRVIETLENAITDYNLMVRRGRIRRHGNME